eukprot:4892905-Pleurochrysis_carterae.AAC.1
MYCSADPDGAGIKPLHKEKYLKDGVITIYNCLAEHHADIGKHLRCRPAPSRQENSARPDDDDE